MNNYYDRIITDEEILEIENSSNNDVEKGLKAEILVLNKLQNLGFPEMESVRSQISTMDLYDKINKFRIEVKYYKNDNVNSDNAKFVSNIMTFPNENMYMYINLACKDLKSRIIGNVYILNIKDFTFSLLEILKNTLYISNKTTNSISLKHADKYQSSQKYLINKTTEDIMKNIKQSLQTQLANMTHECPLCGWNIHKDLTQDDIEKYNLENYILLKEHKEILLSSNNIIGKLENDNKKLYMDYEILKTKYENLQKLKQNSDIEISDEEIEKMKIMDIIFNEFHNDLEKGIKKDSFIENVKKYCFTNNITILDNNYIKQYTEMHCLKEARIKTDDGESRCYKLPTPKRAKKIKKSDDNINYEDINIIDNDIKNINITPIDEKCNESGFGKINLKEMIIINSWYYNNYNKTPSRNESFEINGIKINLSRQICLAKTKHDNIYNIINEKCYGGLLTVPNESNVVKFICDNILYCINNKINFFERICRLTTRSPHDMTLSSILQRCNYTGKSCKLLKIIYADKSEIIKIISENYDIIREYNLDISPISGDNTRCTNIYVSRL